MTTKRTTKIAEVLIDAEDDDVIEEAIPTVPEPAPVVVAPTTKSAKVKGTWTMYYGTQVWDFVDGRRYELPMDLFNYLRKNGNIYDTL